MLLVTAMPVERASPPESGARARSDDRAGVSAQDAGAAKASHPQGNPNEIRSVGNRPAVQLELGRGAGAEACPDVQSMKGAVTARLGYSPFVDRSQARITVQFERGGSGLRARVERREASKRAAVRELSSQAADCTDLARSVELAIAVAVDPVAWLQPDLPPSAQEPRPTAEPSPEPAAVKPPQAATQMPPEKATPARRWGFEMGLGGFGAWGTGPAAVGGGILHVGTQTGLFGLALEGRTELPSSARYGAGRVVTHQLVGTLVPCVRWRFLGGCALASFGKFQAASEGLLEPKQPETLTAQLGGRLEGLFTIFGPWQLVAHGDVLAPLTRVSVTVGGTTAWVAPFINLSFGAQLRVLIL